MLKISNISEGLTEVIRKNMPIDDVKAEQIEYGIYMTISEVIKISVILLISALLDVLLYTVVTMLVFGTHRNFIGGVHAKTHWGCFVSYGVITLGTVYASMYLNIDKALLCVLIYPICMLIAYKYAPADITNKPVASRRQRRNLRIGGFTFMTVVFVAALFLPHPYSNLLIVVSLIECITMLPIVYKITGNEYGRKEVQL